MSVRRLLSVGGLKPTIISALSLLTIGSSAATLASTFSSCTRCLSPAVPGAPSTSGSHASQQIPTVPPATTRGYWRRRTEGLGTGGVARGPAMPGVGLVNLGNGPAVVASLGGPRPGGAGPLGVPRKGWDGEEEDRFTGGGGRFSRWQRRAGCTPQRCWRKRTGGVSPWRRWCGRA